MGSPEDKYEVRGKGEEASTKQIGYSFQKEVSAGNSVDTVQGNCQGGIQVSCKESGFVWKLSRIQDPEKT